jgi:hypothetical protein
MGVGVESRQSRIVEHRSSSIKVPIVLRAGQLRLSVDSDGSVRHLESLEEGRLIFGREQLHLYRLQAGVLGQAQKQDWRVIPAVHEAAFSARVWDSLEVSQVVSLLPTTSVGYSRRLSLKNTGASVAKLRAIEVCDPTTAHFRDRSYGWGSIGVNAFNRSSHVAIDEAVEPRAARVIGSRPPPRVFYMTADKGKALDLLQSGELPEQTAGMSGQVLVLAEHEIELPPGGNYEVAYVLLYNPRKLEAALADFGSLPADVGQKGAAGSWFACSSGIVTSALAWAMAGLEGVEYEGDLLDRLETLRGLAFVNSDASKRVIQLARDIMDEDGHLPHSLNPWKPGVLETSVFLDGASKFALMTGDKKYARSLYPAIRRAGNFLVERSTDGVVKLDANMAQGWRRRIGRGYPAGELPEVSLSVAAALAQAAGVASRVGKAQDSARFKERSVIISSSVRKRFIDERGFLALNLDDAGGLRADESLDQAVACYRHPFEKSVSASLVHRLLEKDFDSGYGPRTIPSSNRMFFSSSYGEGQVGGFWTRAAITHAVLSYQSGFGGTGSLELETVGKLATADVVRYGGAPGDFPYWFDPERKEVHGRGSDPVACARYIEALLTGELGLSISSQGLRLAPSLSSSLRWTAAGDLVGGKVSAFVGRAGGRCFTFVAGAEAEGGGDYNFSGAERVKAEDARISAVSFFDPGQFVCAGNWSEAPVRTRLVFRPRDSDMTKRLTVGLNELETQAGSWKKIAAIKVVPHMSFELSLGPGEWKAFKLSS